jgi:hypothetical protein
LQATTTVRSYPKLVAREAGVAAHDWRPLRSARVNTDTSALTAALVQGIGLLDGALQPVLVRRAARRPTIPIPPSSSSSYIAVQYVNNDYCHPHYLVVILRSRFSPTTAHTNIAILRYRTYARPYTTLLRISAILLPNTNGIVECTAVHVGAFNAAIDTHVHTKPCSSSKHHRK